MTRKEENIRVEAEYRLGLAYLNGDHVQQNKDFAIIILQKAADKGHKEAIALLDQLDFPQKREIYPENLIHNTGRGERVRSKSEVIIADTLFHYQIEYQYERPLRGKDNTIQCPDFTVFCFDGSIILWEHLGLLNNEGYRMNWESKKHWYEMNGFIIGENLFISQDTNDGRIDSQEIHQIASHIKKRMYDT